MDSEEEKGRLERVRELEAMVQKLTVENEKLMNDRLSPSHSSKPERKSPPVRDDKQLANEDSDEDMIQLSDADDDNGDQWLFVSPTRPPTPKQKKVTPREWLQSDIHSGKVEKDIPSLDDVRKALSSTMDDAEQLVKSPLLNRSSRHSPQSHNKTAQRYLGRPRQQRSSPSSESEGSSPGSISPANLHSRSPLIANRQQSNTPSRPLAKGGQAKRLVATPPTNEPPASSLKVSWTPHSDPNCDDDEHGGDSVVQDEELRSLKVKWTPNMPDEELADDESKPLKVKWKAKMPVEDEEEQASLKVKWKAKMPVEDEEEQTSLKVKWKAKMPVEDEEENGEDASLKVNWKAKMPVEDEEENDEDTSLKVKWKAKMPVEDEEEQTSLKVKWNPRMPPEDEEENTSLKVKWKAKMPVEDEESEEQAKSLKVKWTPQMPTEDDDDVPVVKWNPKQVPKEPAAAELSDEQVPRVNWKSVPQSKTHQIQRPGTSPTTSLRFNASRSPQQSKVHNPLKVQWNPNMAANSASSEEDISEQQSSHLSHQEEENPKRQSRYSAHASKQVTPPSSKLQSRRISPGMYNKKPVANVMPIQKSSGLRQPSAGHSSIPSSYKQLRAVPDSRSAVRARSLSPVQGDEKTSSPTGNHEVSPQSRLLSPAQRRIGGSLGRKAGMKAYQSLTPPSAGRPAHRETAQQSVSSSIPSSLQQRRQLPSVQTKLAGPRSKGIKQPLGYRKPSGTSKIAQSRSGEGENKGPWLEGCF